MAITSRRFTCIVCSLMALPLGRRLQTVQVFRGAAALLVVLFHATSIDKSYLQHEFLGDIFMFGYGGVDFFFVLSGFVIVLAHGRDVGHADRLGPYLARRFVRIYPVYWIVAIMLAPLYVGAPHDAAGSVALLRAILLLNPNDNPIVGVAWSLTHEVLFYGMFGLAIGLPSRYARPLLTTWLVLSAAWYLAFFLTHGRLVWPVAGFFFSPYNLEFAMGAAVAAAVRVGSANRGRALAVAGAVLFLLSGASEHVLHRHFSQRHSIVCYGFPSMLLVAGAVQWELSRRTRMPALLLLLGDASYSIYLTHYAMLDLLARASIRSGLAPLIGATATTAILVVLAVGLGVAFYERIERPVLNALRPRAVISRRAPPADSSSEP